MGSYQGGCHCGAVRYRVELQDLTTVLSCNCSICSKKGYMLTFAPAEAFTLLQGADSLSDYQFNKRHIHHLFCKQCGIGSFSRGAGPDGKEMIAINVRCLDDVDPTQLAPTFYDGKSV